MIKPGRKCIFQVTSKIKYLIMAGALFFTTGTLLCFCYRYFFLLFISFWNRYGHQCCPLVMDPLTWLGLLAGIAVATVLLRQAIIDNIGKKRRRRQIVTGEDNVQAMEGKIPVLMQLLRSPDWEER